MKKLKVLAICLFTMTFVGCAGCGGNKEPEQPVDNQSLEKEIVINTNEEKEAIEPECVVGEQYSNEGSFEIKYGELDEGYTYEYSYHLPEIQDDSNDARKINRDIYNIAKESIEVAEKMTTGDAEFATEPEYRSVQYESYENGDIISLVVISDAVYSDWKDYSVFNYNKSTHKIAANPELLKIADLEEHDFLTMARNTLGPLALNVLDDFLGESVESSEVSKDDEDYAWKSRMVADCILNYTYTISEENVNKNMMMYFDADGDLCICGFVHVSAGAGQYYRTVKLSDMSAEDAIDKYKEYYAKYYYSGFERDCLGLFEQEGYSGNLTHEVDSGDSYDDQVYIGFSDADPSEFLIQFYSDDYSLAYSGSLKWVDCDENGLEFEYELDELDSVKLADEEIHKGSFYLKPYGYFDERTGEYVSGAYYKAIDGEDMLDTKPGKVANLIKSFG